MIDKDYIFNVPKEHVCALLRGVYTTKKQQYALVVQEIGEFLQAYSKYSMCEGPLENLRAQREHLIEEMTHVLVCLGMIAMSEGVLQSEIDAQIQKKALDGVKYPFDINKHAPIDQVVLDLERCAKDRSFGKTSIEESCLSCQTGQDGDATLTCRPLLRDALYYLKKAYAKSESSDHK